jgi:hypothetical protein
MKPLNRILLAPAMPALDSGRAEPGSFGGPKDSLKSFVDDVLKISAPEPPPPKKEDKTDGKTAAPERSGERSPGDKLPVGADAPAGEGKAGDGTDVPPKPDAASKPPEAKVEPAKEAAADWEKAPAPRNAKEWDGWKKSRRDETAVLKKEIETRDTRLTELQTKLSEAETKATTANGELPPAAKSEIERLQAENKSLHEAFITTKVESDPVFIKHFGDQTDAAVTKAKKLVGAEKADQIAEILNLPDGKYKDEQLEQFMGEIESTVTRSRLGVVLEDLDKVRDAREREIKKASVHKQEKDAQSMAHAEHANKVVQAAFDSVQKEMTSADKGLAVFQKRDGNDAWNAKVAERLKMAQNLLMGQNIKPDTAVKAAFYAVALPVLMEAYIAERAQVKKEKDELEKTIAGLKAAQPNGGGHKADGGEGTEMSRVKKNEPPWKHVSAFARDAAKMANE